MLIVVGTSPDRIEWLSNSFKSISSDAIFVSDFSFELGKLAWVAHNTSVDRFLFLQDSFEIIDASFLQRLDDNRGSISLAASPFPYASYAGVWETSILRRMNIPRPMTKEESVWLEYSWTREYIRRCRHFSFLFDKFPDRGERVLLNGRNNQVLENGYIRKYKGTWNANQLDEKLPKDKHETRFSKWQYGRRIKTAPILLPTEIS